MAVKKTTKAAVTSRKKQTSVSGKTSKSKKVTSRMSMPTEEEIRKKAEEIYHERIARGEHGTAEDDWHKAERLLKGLKK